MKQAEKKYFNVKLEAKVPCIVTYRVYASSPEEAIEEMKRASPEHIKHLLHLKRDEKATVYEAGSSIIQLIKKWFV